MSYSVPFVFAFRGRCFSSSCVHKVPTRKSIFTTNVLCCTDATRGLCLRCILVAIVLILIVFFVIVVIFVVIIVVIVVVIVTLEPIIILEKGQGLDFGSEAQSLKPVDEFLSKSFSQSAYAPSLFVGLIFFVSLGNVTLKMP